MDFDLIKEDRELRDKGRYCRTCNLYIGLCRCL